MIVKQYIIAKCVFTLLKNTAKRKFWPFLTGHNNNLRQQFSKMGWGPFQGVHEVKTILIDYTNANNIINSCHFHCGYVTMDAEGTKAKVSKTAWASTWIKGVAPNCTGGNCILPCHTFTVDSCQIHLRTSLMKQ